MWSHWVAHQTELQLANAVAKLPDQVVVKYGDVISRNGADVVSVNGRTADVNLWDAKYRSGAVDVKESETFTDASRRSNAVRDAIDAIERASNLSPAIQQKAIQNLISGNFKATTVAQGQARTSYISTFVGGKKR